jgi:hypothetical protein
MYRTPLTTRVLGLAFAVMTTMALLVGVEALATAEPSELLLARVGVSVRA